MPVRFHNSSRFSVRLNGNNIYRELGTLWEGQKAFINVDPVGRNDVLQGSAIKLSKPLSQIKNGLRLVSSVGEDGGVRSIYLPNKDYTKINPDYKTMTQDPNVIDIYYPLWVDIKAKDIINYKELNVSDVNNNISNTQICKVKVVYIDDSTIKFETEVNGTVVAGSNLHMKYTNSEDVYNVYPILDKIVEI
ncbi:hypothetical protein GPK34_00685 [Secundilactobacillus kimchicus]|uniref:hypothetical protein n=1 Tax=Secundilactobacillus kimchicus TaxID=528209 RepID=UPI001C0308E8|nr:hypothetical protein [Secundilactobacillus kimchicus]MBT9670554.1 hypothetical protein [Secundilactobacillus kimchicus]